MKSNAEIVKIVEHILREIAPKERAEFEEELLDWEHSIMLRKSGPSVRVSMQVDGAMKIITIPKEVADFILVYNDKSL